MKRLLFKLSTAFGRCFCAVEEVKDGKGGDEPTP